MTIVARLTLAEAPARALADAIGESDALDFPAVAALETGPGRWEVTVYFEAAPRLEDLTALAQETVGGEGDWTIETLPETDWVAKSLEGLPPVRAGRFLVHGAHDRDRRLPNDIAIEIEAAEAFGTGHHGTTAGCLIAIDRLAKSRPIGTALDLGTGSGVLAIALARLGVTVLASDIDPVAVRAAAGNVAKNGVRSRVRTVHAAGLDARIFAEWGPFDLIVANILAGPLARLAPAIRRALAPGGTVILSGILPEQAMRVIAAYRGQTLRLVRRFVRDGWVTLIFAR